MPVWWCRRVMSRAWTAAVDSDQHRRRAVPGARGPRPPARVHSRLEGVRVPVRRRVPRGGATMTLSRSPSTPAPRRARCATTAGRSARRGRAVARRNRGFARGRGRPHAAHRRVPTAGRHRDPPARAEPTAAESGTPLDAVERSAVVAALRRGVPRQLQPTPAAHARARGGHDPRPELRGAPGRVRHRQAPGVSRPGAPRGAHRHTDPGPVGVHARRDRQRLPRRPRERGRDAVGRRATLRRGPGRRRVRHGERPRARDSLRGCDGRRGRGGASMWRWGRGAAGM